MLFLSIQVQFEHPGCAHPLIVVANGNGLWVETKILLEVLVLFVGIL